MKLVPYLTLFIKINPKQIKHLTIRPKTIEFLEENIGENLHDTGLGNDFLDIIPKTQATKPKIEKTASNFKIFVYQRIQSTE